MQTNIIKIIIGIGLAIGVISLYLLLSIEMPKKPLAGQGDMYNDDVQIGGDFKLTDQDGKIFNSDSLKGNLRLIYFGFTYCPDICPASLQKIAEVVNTLSKYGIEITPVFITIDPERDTSTVLKEYLKQFHSKFIGLTGSKEKIREVADEFKVYYAIANPGSDKAGYMIDHSSFVYLMSENGKYLKHFYLDSSSSEIIEFLRVMNSQNRKN
ncbi:SCO family protein [Rickettsia endosymbiont of Halotydeus destructor]|uniref:SCO family protein n=1 Tax=Rickettsia endosymbiont of Halotydeus destructor TaxID=2996754 RepID=UPI003BAFD39B